jgi:hypothetical protein
MAECHSVVECMCCDSTWCYSCVVLWFRACEGDRVCQCVASGKASSNLVGGRVVVMLAQYMW